MNVDDLDYDEIKAAVQQGYALGDAGYEPDLDLDRDGKITNDDFTLFDAWYGKSKAGPGLISDPAGPDNRIGYAGYVFNPEALIYTVRHRHYDPMLGRFMSADWLGYADGMNLYEYVGGRAMNFNDPSGLAWYNPLTWGLGGADESDIQATKDKYCQSQKDEYGQGKMCKDEFEKRWKNGGCGQSVSSEISDAAITGFGQGAHDGYVKTSHSAVNAMTFGLLDEIAPLSRDDFYDPDNPYLVVSDIMGTIAGEALSIVLTGGAKGVCINVCFAEGTLVATEDGLRPIEDIRPGDLVWSFDEATGFATLSPVVRTFESTADELVELTLAGETIRVTPDHPFWVDGLGWIPARELCAGTPVLARDGGVAAAAHVRPFPGPARTFNIEVAGTHTYIVTSGGYVVHNACVYQIMQRMADGTVQVFKYGVSRKDFVNGTLKRANDQVRDLIRSGKGDFFYEQVLSGKTWRHVLDDGRRLVEWGKRHLPGWLPGNPRWRPPY